MRVVEELESAGAVNAPEQKTEPRSRPSPLFWVVVLAIVVRLCLFVVAHGFVFVDMPVRDDSSLFNEATNIANSIASGHGFTTPMMGIIDGKGWTGASSWLAPVYPYFCAAVFWLLGPFSRQSFVIILLVQCVVSALVCIPIFRIGERTVGRTAGYIAAFLWAAFPWFSKWAITWIWEIDLSVLLFAWLFWYALKMEDVPGWKAWAGFGALWGFAILVNPALMTLIPVSAVWIVYRRTRNGLGWLQPSVWAAAVCLLVISPWIICNRVVFGEWAFVRSNFGFEFALGNFHGSNGRGYLGNHPMGSREEFNAYKSMGEPAYVRWKSQQAMQFVREYPSEFAWLTLKRIPWFWDGSGMRYNHTVRPYWLPWSFALLSVLLVPSILLACVRRVHAWAMFLGIIVLYPLPYYLTYSQVRYRHVLEPLMLLLLGYAVVTLSRFRRSAA